MVPYEPSLFLFLGEFSAELRSGLINGLARNQKLILAGVGDVFYFGLI